MVESGCGGDGGDGGSGGDWIEFQWDWFSGGGEEMLMMMPRDDLQSAK